MEINKVEHENTVAIVGMACRFPGGASSPDKFWKLLENGIDATCEVPEKRWNLKKYYDIDRETPGKTYVCRGGFLEEPIDQFDYRFFGISPREAQPLDPQQRLLLEVTWEAFEDAGILPGGLRGSDTGVYIGGFTLDNKIHLLNVYNREIIGTHTAISSTAGMLANRISYTFDLHGPSMTVDTACSSSAVSLHLACRDLLDKTCSLAVSGGVNIMLRPEYFIAMCKGGFLSPDGRCKTFDEKADGYARGEGAGILILKRLKDALADGDRIYAVVAGSGVNQDGHSDGITSPNTSSQIELIEGVYKQAGVSPDEIQYVEAHGTGTMAGDIAETNSLGKALGIKRSGQDPLLLGSVKPNTGHLEAAAGVCSVMKAVLALNRKTVPPNLNFNNPNPSIDFNKLRLKVPVQPTPWPQHKGPAGVGINAFGYGGTNAHIILRQAPGVVRTETPVLNRSRMFVFSAMSSASLITGIQKVSGFLEKNFHLSLGDTGYSLARRRAHFKQRWAVCASSMQELREALYPFNRKKRDWPQDTPEPGSLVPDSKCLFVFTGMGAQYRGMGKALWESNEQAAGILEECDAIWKKLAGWSLIKLFAENTGEPMTDPRLAQPANLVLQLMIERAAGSYGLRARGMLGHSVGEIAAARASGALSLEEALFVIYNRSRLYQRITGKGGMLSAGLSASELQPYLAAYGDRLCIAAVNSHESVTLAGELADLRRLARKLTEEGHFNRLLKVDVAYHSHHVNPLQDDFLSACHGITPQVPRVDLYSSVTGTKMEAAGHDAAYWWRNMREPVNFMEAITAAIEDGYNTFVEIGAHPVLASSIKACLHQTGKEGQCFSFQNRKDPTLKSFYDTLASLYIRGIEFDWKKQYPSGNFIPMPTYPWDREVLWNETELSRADRIGLPGHPLLKPRPDEPLDTWEGELPLQEGGYLQDHRVQGDIVFPGAGFIEMALVTQGRLGESIILENFRFQKVLSLKQTPIIRMVLDAGKSEVTIFSRSRKSSSQWHTNASGKLGSFPPENPEKSPEQDLFPQESSRELDIAAFYSLTGERGLQYGRAFRVIRQGKRGKKDILTQLILEESLTDEAADYYIHPTILDGAFQSLLAIEFTESSPGERQMFLPAEIEQLRFYRKTGAEAWCYARVTGKNSEKITGDLFLYTREGKLSLKILGFKAKSLTRDSSPDKHIPYYSQQWVRQDTTAGPLPGKKGKWLIFSDTKGIGSLLAEKARPEAGKCVEVHPGDCFKKDVSGNFTVRRNSREDMLSLIRSIDATDLAAVIYLWGLDIPGDGNSGDEAHDTGITDVIDLTHIIQALDKTGAGKSLTLCLGLCRGQNIKNHGECRNPGQNSLIGFGRTLLNEGLDYRIKIVDLNSYQAMRGCDDLLREITAGDNETEIAVRDGMRYVNRITAGIGKPEKKAVIHDRPFVLKQDHRTFAETEGVDPGKGEVQIAVDSCSFNQRNAGRTHSWYYAGVITALGADVQKYSIGQTVALLAPYHGIQSHLSVKAESLVPVPGKFPVQQAALLPDLVTAYYALFHAGKLEPGQNVLVHHGTSGSALGVILLARLHGARVFATTDSGEKMSFLRSLGIEHVFSTKDISFYDAIKALCPEKGMDLVLSPSFHLMEKSLGLIAEGGSYVSIGADPSPPRGVAADIFKQDFHFCCVTSDKILRQSPKTIDSILSGIAESPGDSIKAMLPPRVYTPASIRGLFEEIPKNEYTGNLILKLRDEPVALGERLVESFLRPQATYLITGGFGGFGLATMRWLAAHKVRDIAVMSRSGVTSQPAGDIVADLRNLGIRIRSYEIDITDRKAVEAARRRMESELPPLKGIIHSAAVVNDAKIELLTESQIREVMGAKAVGAWNLHHVFSTIPLDFFICYSSVSGMLGNLGQANYAAANTFLDGLMQYRRSLKKPGMSISWGKISDSGMVAGNRRLDDYLSQLGLRGISTELALEGMFRLMVARTPQAGIFNIDWQQWMARTGNAAGQERRLSPVLTSSAGSHNESDIFRQKIRNLPQQARLLNVQIELKNIISAIMGIHTSRMEKKSSLLELGIDSLMATELKSEILGRMGVRFRILYFMSGPDIQEISESIVRDIVANKQQSQIAVR